MSKVVSIWVSLALCFLTTAGYAQRNKPKRSTRTSLSVSANGNAVDRDTAEKKKRASLDATNAMVLASVGPELGIRSFSYNQALLGGLRSYSNNAIPMGSVGVEFYPLAASGTPIVRDIGLVGRFGTSLSFDSKTQSCDQSAKGTWSRYAVGARGRIHAGDGPGHVLVGIEAMYGDSKFEFTGTDALVASIPSIDYKYIRGGADVRIPFGAFALLGGAGYVNILSTGPFGDKFPHATLGGVDAKIAATYRVAQNVELLASGDYLRVFSKLNPRPGETFVAGGALDQYFVFRAGVSLLF
jgi:hypothetical protein